ncbi:MAG: hypothetical protein QFB86_01360 [Patescibacteria group bacterium]|nr:hypothetical protein [Patescibacteria group bacterium]
MNVRKNEQGNIALAAVAVVVGLVVGFAVASVSKSDTNNNKTASSTPAGGTSQKASDLRADLVTLGVDHMTLTQSAVAQTLDGSKGAEAAAAALYANGNDIGAKVGSVYGADAEKTFDSVWKLHLDQFVAYAGAASKGDEAGKKAALDTIDSQYTKPLSAFLAKANPNLPEKTLNTVLSDHVQMTAAMIDDHVAGKYADEQAALKQANEHMATIMSTLAGGIAKQKNL